MSLLESLLVALTDAQFDRVLAMISELLNAMGSGVKAVWDILSPLLIGIVAIQLAYYQAKAKEARKMISDKLETESTKSQTDRTKIINDVAENTQVSVVAFDAANGTNAKIAELMAEIKELKKNQIPPL